MSTEPRFFARPVDFRRWLEKNHSSARELWVGFYKVASGKPSITWPQSVDEALCFGWIDGVRKSLDDASYMIRFTPRRAGSIWSAVNTKRAHELLAEGRMHAAGAAAFAQRDEDRTKKYSYEQGKAELSPEHERIFRRNKAAWAFFEAQPPSYRQRAMWWVSSAVRAETRDNRLAQLIVKCAAGSRLGPGRDTAPARTSARKRRA